MENGTVKWFNDAKGFGFVTPDAGGGELLTFRKPGLESLTEYC